MTGPGSSGNGSALPLKIFRGSFTLPKPELGTKRDCLSCGAKFYDLNRSPAICPKCGAEFLAEATTRTRRAKTAEKPATAAAAPETAAETDETPADEAEEDTVSLEALQDEEDSADDFDEDIDVDDAGDDDDNTFIEDDDDDDDDVSSLVRGEKKDDDDT